MEKQTSKPLIQVLDRTMDILEFLAQADRPVPFTEISEKLDIGIKTTNNILRSLFERGYVTQDERRSYRLGGRCIWLGTAADQWQELRKISAPVLKKLSVQTSSSAFLGVINSDKLFCVALVSKQARTNWRFQHQDWADELHSTACGRVLLAGLPENERIRLLARNGRKKLTDKTVIAPRKLEELCAVIQKQGYAEVQDESVIGTCSLAIPIENQSGETIAAIAFSSKKAEWLKTPLEEKLAILRKAAATITAKL